MTKELAIKILRGDVLGTNEQTHEAVFMAIRALKAEPKRGRWIWEKPSDDCRCSNCGKIVDQRYRYCPNCGAKMDEVKE